MDIGESLVGAYLRHVEKCHTIAFNQFLPSRQGEIDVIGLAGAGKEQRVWLIEVAIHLDGLNYGGYEATAHRIEEKVRIAREYATEIYRDLPATIEFWSPRIPAGLVSRLADLDGVSVIANESFTDRVNVLAARASGSTKQYGDEAFRFLQLLTHLRGAPPTFARPTVERLH